jgi:uncharacterized surface protein with fasciclin (FAS1) repeats
MTLTQKILATGATAAILGMSLTGSALATYDDNHNEWQDRNYSYNHDQSWDHDDYNWDEYKHASSEMNHDEWKNDNHDWDKEDHSQKDDYSWNHEQEKDNECTEKDKTTEEVLTSDKDIVDNAVANPNLTTLVAAVQAAGLVETLKGTGPFTVFAPTNAAFGKLPAGTVDSLLLPENKSKLSGILTYHVVPGTYKASDLYDGLTLTTVNGQSLTFTMKDGGVYINGTTKVEAADAVSSNGVSHVIDSVLLPTN